MNLVNQVNEESSHENYSGAFNKKHAYEVDKNDSHLQRNLHI